MKKSLNAAALILALVLFAFRVDATACESGNQQNAATCREACSASQDACRIH